MMRVFTVLVLALTCISLRAQPSIKLPEFVNQTDSREHKQGTWVEVHSNRSIKSIEHYKDGELHGMRIVMSDKGQILEQEMYRKGKREGLQRYYNSAGVLIREAIYVNGEKNGMEWEYYNTPGNHLKQTSLWKDDVKDGASKWYFPEGQISAVYHYDEGKIEGLVQYFYATGQLRSETMFLNSQKNGDYTEYHTNGQVKVKGRYENNKPVGLFEYFDEYGAPERTESY